MGTVYIIGAGFSKTCGIATDLGMLDSLNPMLATETIGNGAPRTTIDYLREQNFRDEKEVGFESFMSTLTAAKFINEFLESNRKIFQEEEREIRKALCSYLKSCVHKVNWEVEGKIILDFMERVDWKHDFILTFNYDLLIEEAAKRLNVDVGERIIHLHGAIGERNLAWPTYTKFAYRTTKVPLAPRWKRAYNILRNQTEIDRLVFIGYSMPPSDLEAKSLFNYADWNNRMSGPSYEGKRVPADKHYSYPIVVVNPEPDIEKIKANYKFFRKDPEFLPLTLEEWLRAKGSAPQ